MRLIKLSFCMVLSLVAWAWPCRSSAAPIAPDKSACNPTEGYLPQFSLKTEEFQRKTIDLLNDFPDDSAVSEWPVTFGVPFPDGALKSVDNIRIINDAGQAVPSQIARTATWHGPDGNVKWALVDILAQRDEKYTLEFGTDVHPRQFDSTLKVVEDGAAITVDTGPLRVKFSRKNPAIMDSAWLDADSNGSFNSNEQVLNCQSRMQMVDQASRRYIASAKPGDYRLEVETKGPMHLVVKACGWYRDGEGIGLCEYVTRTHLYAGQRFVNVIHTFIVNFNTDNFQIQDISLPLEFAEDAAKKCFFPTDNSPGSEVREAALPVWLTQGALDHFSVSDQSGAAIFEGRRAGGWLAVEGDGFGMAVGMRNMWQEFPMGLAASAQGITVCPWPRRCGRMLDFRAPAALGAERYEKFMADPFVKNFYTGGLEKYDQAFGLAKTHEMIIAFYNHDLTPARAAAATSGARPFVAADPMWMCRSGAFGPYWPKDIKRFPEVEARLDANFRRLEFLRDHISTYGFLDCGDVNHTVKLNPETNKWESRPWRRMVSRFYGMAVMPWMQFARTGDRRFLEWGIDSARHVMDIDMCHATCTNSAIGSFPRFKGSRYGGNGGIIHYGHQPYLMGADTHFSQWLYYYYLTGYRRAWDVLMEEVDFYLDFSHTWDFTSKFYGRHTGGALRAMIELWEATWDNRYLDLARKLAELCYQEADKAAQGVEVKDPFHAGVRDGRGLIRCDDVYMNKGLVTYYQATGDQRMKELFLNCMADLNERRPPLDDVRAFSYYGPTIAYYMTGDPAYLRRSVFWLNQYLENIDMGTNILYYGNSRHHWDTAYNPIHLLYAPYLLGALTTLDEPLEPASDQSATSGEIWLNNPDGRAFSFALNWKCHFSDGWLEYSKALKLQGRIVALDPTGKEAAAAPMDFAVTPYGATVTLNVPAGDAGLYRVMADYTTGVRIWLTPLSDPFPQWVYPVQDSFVAYADAYYFLAPEETTNFTVRFKVWAPGIQPTVQLLNPAGETVREAKPPNNMAPQPWTKWETAVPANMRGKPWCIKVRPLHAKASEFHLRLEGVPPVVAIKSNAFFLPEQMPEKIRPPSPPAPAGVGVPVKLIPAGAVFEIPRGARRDGGYEHINPESGTIEFWFKPGWNEHDLFSYSSKNRSDEARDLLNCGLLSVRRIHSGARISLGNGVILPGVIFPPDAWYHLAVAWDLKADQPEDRLVFLLNGIRLGISVHRNNDVPPPGKDWTGPAIVLRSFTAPMEVAGLRISSVSRADQIGHGMLSPPPDEQTLFHLNRLLPAAESK